MSESLDVLVAEGVIDEVLGRIKSGKEADISMVRRGDEILAAKVYKDRATRSFKNNVEYKEGRKVRNTRTQRAMDNGGKFGRDSAEQAWKSAEADALYKLAGTGVRTPAPVMFYEGVLLMELVRDAEGRPAPRLEELALERESVLGIYCDLLAQLISMLCSDLIHGDLSPYNILLAADGPTIIDFPQVISAAHNSRAEHFFLRDFDNIHSHLASFDPALAPHRADGRAIWQAYVRRDLTPQFVPPPPSTRRTERVFEPRPAHPHRGSGGNGGRPGGGRPGPRSDAAPPQRPVDQRPPPRSNELQAHGRPGAERRVDDQRAIKQRTDDQRALDQRPSAQRAYDQRMRAQRALDQRPATPPPSTPDAPTPAPAHTGGRPADLRPKYPRAGAVTPPRPTDTRSSGRPERGGYAANGRGSERSSYDPRGPQSRPPASGRQPYERGSPPPRDRTASGASTTTASAQPTGPSSPATAPAGPPRRRRRRYS